MADLIKTHTELSPSNAERWMNCPGSRVLCRKMPKPPQSANAAEGTAAHALLERCLRNPKINPFDLIGETIEEYEVTDEMAEAVAFAIDVVKSELQKGGRLLIEKPVLIMSFLGGTIDIAIIREFDEIVVLDFKYGKGIPVSAVDNKQLLLYLLGLTKYHEAIKFRIGIIQPRIESNQLSIWDVPEGYMDTFEAEVNRRIALTEEPNALVIQGSWCRWCNAKAVCPAMHAQVADMFPAIKEEPKSLRLPDVKTLSPQRVSEILDIADSIKEWFSAVAAYAADYLDIGGTIPNYGLVKKRANRRWKDEAAALAAFSDLGEKAFSVKILSPAQMEKIAGKDRVAEHTEVPDTGTTLKRIGAENDTTKQIDQK